MMEETAGEIIFENTLVSTDSTLFIPRELFPNNISDLEGFYAVIEEEIIVTTTEDVPATNFGSSIDHQFPVQREDGDLTIPESVSTDNLNDEVDPLNGHHRPEFRKVNEKMWAHNQLTVKVLAGEAHEVTYSKRSSDDGTKIKITSVVPAKKPRLEDCDCDFGCRHSITPDHQLFLFDEYRRITTRASQREYIHSLLNIGAVQRRRVESPKVIRSVSVQYFLMNADGVKVRVCQKFFCKTFGFSKKVCANIVKKTSPTSNRYDSSHGNKGKAPKRATSPRVIRKVAKFIAKIPKMPSHYCRTTLKQLYFEPNWKLSTLHAAYNDEVENEFQVSYHVFKRVFNQWEPKLGFFVPKKDQCTMCNMKDESDPEYQAHIERKKNIRNMKKADKANASTSKNLVYATFDFEATLVLPYAEDSQLYYSKKLKVYNLSIFDSNQNGICHVYDETNGSKGSTEVASCLLDYLASLDNTVTNVVFYADTASGQRETRQQLN